MNRLALGTAQFGSTYGVGNTSGQVRPSAAQDIIDRAFTLGINTLDTAIAYGNSEQVLGKIGVTDWKIISKLPPLPEGVTNIEAWTCKEVEGSLARLGVPRLYGLLLHRSDLLLGQHQKSLQLVLKYLKQQDKISKTGVSIYDPNELYHIEKMECLELVQTPLNVLDTRIIDSGWLSRLNARGVEVHARSIFLQGLLLMPATRRPTFFNHWKSVWCIWENWLIQHNITPLQACIGFALSVPGIAHVIVGVDSLSHLDDILDAATQELQQPLPQWPQPLEKELTNPSLWKY